MASLSDVREQDHQPDEDRSEGGQGGDDLEDGLGDQSVKVTDAPRLCTQPFVFKMQGWKILKFLL